MTEDQARSNEIRSQIREALVDFFRSPEGKELIIQARKDCQEKRGYDL